MQRKQRERDPLHRRDRELIHAQKPRRRNSEDEAREEESHRQGREQRPEGRAGHVDARGRPGVDHRGQAHRAAIELVVVPEALAEPEEEGQHEQIGRAHV